MAVQENWIFFVSVYRSIAIKTISKIDLKNGMVSGYLDRVNKLVLVLLMIIFEFLICSYAVVELGENRVQDLRAVQVTSGSWKHMTYGHFSRYLFGWNVGTKRSLVFCLVKPKEF